MAKKAPMDKGEQGVGKGDMVSPLSYQGTKGGNSESPAPMAPKAFTPPDPLGVLPEGSTERGKSGPGYGG